jgi:hypothetical protein
VPSGGSAGFYHAVARMSRCYVLTDTRAESNRRIVVVGVVIVIVAVFFCESAKSIAFVLT